MKIFRCYRKNKRISNKSNSFSRKISQFETHIAASKEQIVNSKQTPITRQTEVPKLKDRSEEVPSNIYEGTKNLQAQQSSFARRGEHLLPDNVQKFFSLIFYILNQKSLL